MKFIDEARIFVQAGNGGQGCESHYKDNYTRYPRADGGDGGRGGDVIFVADRGMSTLLDYSFNQHQKAESGGHGSSKGAKGRTGKDCILKVPVGTIVRDDETHLIMKDLTADTQSVVAARGGRGGFGNGSHKYVSEPQKGESRTIALELKLMADVGIIGFPNAGKSTLVTVLTNAHSKIANYPFTTKHPILGMASVDDFNFVIADLPGLIEGAHEGRGLGDQFLRHVERTKILLHLIDMAGTDGRDPIDDYQKIEYELSEFSEELISKKRLVVANKMDLPQSSVNLKRFRKKVSTKIYLISAEQRTGLDELKMALKEMLCIVNSPDRSSE